MKDVTSAGVTYSWDARQRRSDGKSVDAHFTRFVRATDLAGAPRLNTVFWSDDQADYPGYTAFSISTTVYQGLLGSGEAPFTVSDLDQSDPFGGALVGMDRAMPAFGGLAHGRVTLKGMLTRVSQPEPFPLLVSGRRTTVSALRVRGRFAFQERHLEQEFWILADSAHPLILRVVTGGDTLQTVRVEVPDESGAPAALELVERELASVCRAELPGVYFAFATADLGLSSERTLEAVARMMVRHPDWNLSIEGHTDSVGTASANQALSERRAEAVQRSLVGQVIRPERLRASGFGASRPRESNSTIEGRARNRRVELSRPCGAKHQGAHS